MQEYLETFATNLEKFRITGIDKEFDELVVENIGNFIPYRNEAIEFFLALAQYYNTKESHNQLHRFFEKLVPYLERPENVQSYREWDYDNFKFIIHELFLYCVAALLKHEAYDAVAYLLRNRYFVARDADYGRNSMRSFELFRSHLKSLESRNSRLKLNRLSLHADLLRQRCVATGVTFDQVMQADFLLLLRDYIDTVRDNSHQGWWPDSLLNIVDRERPFEIFARAESNEYFQSIKVPLGIEKKEDFVPIFTAIKEEKLGSPSWEYRRISIAALMGYEALATRP
jgi:hypothetical protein